MDRLKSCSPEERKAVILELQNIGCCKKCILRYLGIVESGVYQNIGRINEIISQALGKINGNEPNIALKIEVNEYNNHNKMMKRNPCSACLGLLEHGIKEDWLHKIADTIKESGIEALSFCPSLSLPISIQIRAYSIWFHMKSKFPEAFVAMEDLRPEGTAIKSVWKWLCCDELRRLVNPDCEWGITGCVSVQLSTSYSDDNQECKELENYLQQVEKKKKKRRNAIVTRGTVQSVFQNMKCDEFLKTFLSPPDIPNNGIIFGACECSHSSIFVAGRYCKYSRTLSQTPWILDGVRKTESSVEELISEQIVPFLQAEESKFLSSGREDVDVRTLGRGRPFACEIINPKKTIFSPEKMFELQKKINSSTKHISVHSIQIVEKRELVHLKEGEGSKTKCYNALCSTLGTPVTPEMIEILNNHPLPLVLTQRTPLRVLHRRTSSDRLRSILQMKAEIVKNYPNIFTLQLTTEAGTYVKEFVHGDFGRTTPNVSLLLGTEADIFALDVTEVNLEWPPVAVQDVKPNSTEMETEESAMPKN